jgi:transcriptional regulator GlxA family with amidase domain
MSSAFRHVTNRLLLRARDTMDRDFAGDLDVERLAAAAFQSRAHFIRSFRDAFGETPHRYLQRRRIERAMAMLRDTDKPVTEISLDVGFTSLGTFSRTFQDILGTSPRAYRAHAREKRRGAVPACITKAWNRPSEHFQRSAPPQEA